MSNFGSILINHDSKSRIQKMYRACREENIVVVNELINELPDSVTFSIISSVDNCNRIASDASCHVKTEVTSNFDYFISQRRLPARAFPSDKCGDFSGVKMERNTWFKMCLENQI